MGTEKSSNTTGSVIMVDVKGAGSLATAIWGS